MATVENVTLDLEQTRQAVAKLDRSMQSLGVMFGERCQQIPVEVSTPGQLARKLEPNEAEILDSSFRKIETDGEAQPLDLALLMDVCAPRYFHPGPQVLITWAPELAAKLVNLFPQQRTTILNTLIPSEQEVAAIIAHEKYGHGYLYLKTTLGRQLVHILADNELYQAIVAREEPQFLNTPWKRDFFEENKGWLPYLLGSVVLVEEGFAGWVQTKLLLCMGGRFAFHATYKLTRHPFSVPFKGFIPFMPYFRARGYPLVSERLFSPHKQGYDWVDDIYEFFGYACMPCVLQTVQIAMNIDFGITRDQEGPIHLAVHPSRMERYLREGKPEFYLADQRLVALRNILLDNIDQLETQRKSWLCQTVGPCEVPESRSCEAFLKQIELQLPNWLENQPPHCSDSHGQSSELAGKEDDYEG